MMTEIRSLRKVLAPQSPITRTPCTNTSFTFLVLLATILMMSLSVEAGSCGTIFCTAGPQSFFSQPCVELIGCQNNPMLELQLELTNSTSAIRIDASFISSLWLTMSSSGSGSSAAMNVTITNTVIAGTSATKKFPLLQVITSRGGLPPVPVSVLLNRVNVTLSNTTLYGAGGAMANFELGGGSTRAVFMTECNFTFIPLATSPSMTMVNMPPSSTSDLSFLVADSSFTVTGGVVMNAPLSVFVLTGPILRSAFKFSRFAVNWSISLTSNGFTASQHSCFICFFPTMANTAITVADSDFKFYGRFPENGHVSAIKMAEGLDTTSVSLIVERQKVRMTCSGYGVPEEPLSFGQVSRLFVVRTGTILTNVTVMIVDSVVIVSTIPGQISVGAMIIFGAEVHGDGVRIWLVRCNFSFSGQSDQWMSNFGDPMRNYDFLALNTSYTVVATYSSIIKSTMTSHAVYFGGFAVNDTVFTFRNFNFSLKAHIDAIGKLYAPSVSALIHTVGPKAQYNNFTAIVNGGTTINFHLLGTLASKAAILMAVIAANETVITNSTFVISDSNLRFISEDSLAGGVGVYQISFCTPLSNTSFTLVRSNVSMSVQSSQGFLAGLNGMNLVQANVIGFQRTFFFQPSCRIYIADCTSSLVTTGWIGSSSFVGVESSLFMATVSATNLVSSIQVVGPSAAKQLLSLPWPSHFGFVSSTLLTTDDGGSSIIVHWSTLRTSCLTCLNVNAFGFLAVTVEERFQLSVEDTSISFSRVPSATVLGHVAFTSVSQITKSFFLFRNVVTDGSLVASLISFSSDSLIKQGLNLTVINVRNDPTGDPTLQGTSSAMISLPSSVDGGGTVSIMLSDIFIPRYQAGVVEVGGDENPWPKSATVTLTICQWNESQVDGLAFPFGGVKAFPRVPKANLFIRRPPPASNSTGERCRLSMTESASVSKTRPIEETVTVSWKPVRSIRRVLPAVFSTRIAVAATGVIMAATIPGAGFAIQRTLSQIALSGGATFDPTAPMSVADSPTQMNLGKPVYGPMRGCVVGNVALWCGCVGAAAMVSFVLGCRNGVGFAVAGSRLGLPGMLSIPFDLLLQPTASSSMTLLMYRQGNGDVLLGLLGLGACCLWLVCWVHGFRIFEAHPGKPKEDNEGDAKPGEGGSVVVVLALLRPVRYLTGLECEWMCRTPLDKLAFDAYLPRFADYGPRRQWFLAVDIGSGLLLALLVAYMQSPNDDTPQMPLTAGNLTVCALVLLSCVAWAQNERLARLNYLSTAVISLVSAALGAVNELDAAQAVAVAQVYVNTFATCVDVVSMFAMLLIKAARLQISVFALIASKLGAASEKLQQSEAAAAARAEEEWRQQLPESILEQLYHEGLVIPRPRLRPSEVRRNLSILVKHITVVTSASMRKKKSSLKALLNSPSPAAAVHQQGDATAAAEVGAHLL